MPASRILRTCAASSSYGRISRRASAASNCGTVAGSGLPVTSETPADQHQVAADIERRGLARQAHGVVESGAVGHQRGGGEDAVAVRFDDALVHVAA